MGLSCDVAKNLCTGIESNRFGQLCLVSNLCLLGKIVDKVVGLQFQKPLEEIDYLNTFKPGFRPDRSNEMALMVGDFWQGWDMVMHASWPFVIVQKSIKTLKQEKPILSYLP